MSKKTIDQLNSLPPQKRQQVECLIRKFTNRERSVSLTTSALERLYDSTIQAMYLVALTPHFLAPRIDNVEQAQQYAQYYSVEFAY